MVRNKQISRETVEEALKKVMDPELKKDLITLEMVKNIKIQDDQVEFTIVLTTPACPLKRKIEQDAWDAVMQIPGVENVNIKFDAKVVSDGRQRGLLQLPVQHAIAVASGKGGVGKSTVSVNLAVALAKSGARVGLLDADIYGPNIPTMMGVSQIPDSKDGKLQPAVSYNVKMMSIGFLVKPGQPLIWRGPMLHSAIRQFLSDVEWGELDYLVIDLPPGTGDAQLSLCQSIPLSGVVIVTLPQLVSLEDASRSLAMFKQLNVPILGVVENMSYLELPDGNQMKVFGEGGGAQLAYVANVPLLGSIPMDPLVREGGDEGLPVIISRPETDVAKALTGVAEKAAAAASVAAFKNKDDITIEFN